MLKSLGCSSTQSTRRGVDEDRAITQQQQQQQQQRRWYLRLPLSFPSQRKRGPSRR